MIFFSQYMLSSGTKFWLVPLLIMFTLITWLTWIWRISLLKVSPFSFEIKHFVGFQFESMNNPISIYSFTYLCEYRLMNSYFIQWVTTHYYNYLFWCSNYPRLNQSELPQWAMGLPLLLGWHCSQALSVYIFYTVTKNKASANFF